ncbi:uncharacterized protein [Phaseolus vulgaris]|uniref:uncharacterized protein n=1 Tax=Phaseolus vulgaris TaxID=3885 RepID=UPI0035CBA946
MIVINLNIKGLGGGVKAKYLKHIIYKESAEFVCLQETKVMNFSDSKCFALWGDNNIGWVLNEGENGAGGILSMWNKEVFEYRSHVKGRGFIVVPGIYVKMNCLCVIVNVYAACSNSDKAVMWDALSTIKSYSQNEVWCCCGDFNAVRIMEERKGVRGLSSQKKEIKDFNKFIDRNVLVELPLVGKKFTWYKADGSAKSRLDRFLVSLEWLQRWPTSKQYVLEREVSDHCAIVAKSWAKD